MSIKKEIMNALKNDGVVKINEVSYLKRWTKDGLNNPCDGLSLTFRYITGIKGGWVYDIDARNYEGIVDEICEKTKAYFADCAMTAASNLRAGYR